MIVDHIKNKELYRNLNFYNILSVIKDLNFSKLEEKIYINTNDYYMVNKLQTRISSSGFWESHKKYIDIHYILSGLEVIGYENINNLTIETNYSKDKDLLTYYGALQNAILLREGMFMVLYPEDAHMPIMAHLDVPQELKKVVFKILNPLYKDF